MKINATLSMLTAGVVLLTMTVNAQTTPAGQNQSGTTTKAKSGSISSAGGSQDARYRQSSASEGTSINNSNSTNYNSNNVTNAPTGIGSNPSSTGNPPTTSPASGQPGQSGTNTSTGSTANTGTGTAPAVTGAKTTEEPAVKAGSTVRNTSIHDFIASSPNYTTLQNALQSTGLDDNLKGGKTYTVFAPSNSAFKKLPTAIQVGLLEGRNREALTKLLSYHVVSGSVNAMELARQIKTGNGKSQLQTLGGNTLTVQSGSDGRLTLTDEQGNTAHIDGAENRQSNGVIYGIDAVLMPKSGIVTFH